MWTIQPYSVYQQLNKNGIFYCDPNEANNLKDADFKLAYQWMIEQMEKKISLPPQNVKTPLWAWYRSSNYHHKRPDFRWVRDYPDEVCIEFEIPEKQVLLSDFEAWHFVLNNWYYSPATSEKEWEQDENWFDSLTKSKQQRVKEKSWQRIFDITPRHGKWTKNGDVVQGCFWLMKKDQVKKVWRLRKGYKTIRIKG